MLPREILDAMEQGEPIIAYHRTGPKRVVTVGPRVYLAGEEHESWTVDKAELEGALSGAGYEARYIGFRSHIWERAGR